MNYSTDPKHLGVQETSELSELRALAEAVDEEIRQLGRPSRPSRALTQPRLLRDWQLECEAWVRANPGKAQARAELLDRAAQIEARRRELEGRAANRTWAWDALAQAGVGERLIAALRRPLRDEFALRSADAWWRSSCWALTLGGDVGTGKSLAAAWCAWRQAQAGVAPVWLKASEAATQPIFGSEALANMRRWRTCRFLVIDDLGAETLSAGWRSTFGDLVDARYSARARLLVTSNLNAAALIERYGERVADRLQDEGRVLEVAGGSMRGLQNETLRGVA